jgi:hypothetical protein
LHSAVGIAGIVGIFEGPDDIEDVYGGLEFKNEVGAAV